MRECPKCGKEMDRQDEDPEVGIVGHWLCQACDHTENLEDDDAGD